MAKYIIQDTTLTNIADAIREKADITTPMFPEAMPSHIRSIQTSSADTFGIPDDIVAEADRVASSMISKMGANSLTFIVMSDMHEPGPGETPYSEADAASIRKGNLNAGQAAKLISDKVPLDFFANLGDLAWGSSSTTSTTDLIKSQLAARQYTWDVEKDNESFFTTGNHDIASVDGAMVPGVVSSMTGTYRYVDFDSKKVRVICLNTSDTTDGVTDGSNSGAGRFGGEQLAWFAESLDLSSKSNASEWGIVIISHMPLDWGYIKPAANCLAAYIAGRPFSTTHDSVTVSYNYSGKNVAKVIAQFHGHTHCLLVDNINDLTTGSPVPMDVKRVAIPCSCFKRSNTYGGETTEYNNIDFGESVTCLKTDDNTGRNTAFCLVSIDLDKEIIYADCFGSLGVTEPGINAGYDRVISYGAVEMVTYNITNNLANASNSNGAGTVIEGSSYAASITANDGYILDNVTVTMGGVDITSTAVSSGNISISNVTGDIIITVTTTSNAPYAITYDLVSVTSSNVANEVSPNTAYTTTLTADDGYSINFVRVLMGGVDITSTVYSNGVISIASVTGDIEIIAGYYTNIVPTARTSYTSSEIYNGVGYKNGAYVSSGGSYGTDANTVAVGYLTLNIGDAIYIKGAELAENNHVRLYTQTMSGGALSYCEKPNVSSGGWSDTTGVERFTVEVLGKLYYKLTSLYTEQVLYRMSLYGTGEKLIITHNQPISDVVEVEPATYSVVNNLTNVSTSNTVSSVTEGGSYSAALTANTGYEISAVTVTMSGVDITNTAYRNGTISVSSVTGDITITAMAIEIQTDPSVNYTNLVPTSIDPSSGEVFNGTGYKDGAYASSGGTGADATCVTTGLIAYGDGRTTPIYIKGADVDTTKSHCRILGFMANKTVSFQAAAGSSITTYFTVETLGDSYYKLTPTSDLGNHAGYTDYLRFSLIGTGANLIITLNEPIE